MTVAEKGPEGEATLLVVEDDPNICELLATSLRYAGFTVYQATGGEEAVRAVTRHRPDLVVLDVMLPDFDGFEVARRVRSGSDRTPIVYLTARDALEDKVRGLTLGGDDYVTKPFHVQEVLLRAHVRWTRIGLMERPDLYLRRMVTNEHLSWRRRWHVRTVHPSSDDVLAAHADPAHDHAHRVVEDDALWRRLSELPPRQRAVLVLRYYEGLADLEIAQVLGTSAATVRSHASRALATLRVADLTTES